MSLKLINTFCSVKVSTVLTAEADDSSFQAEALGFMSRGRSAPELTGTNFV
jgi:hypothetical protein